MSETQTLAAKFKDIEDAIIGLHKRAVYHEGMSAITNTLILGVVPQLVNLGALNPKALGAIHGKLAKLAQADLLPEHKAAVATYRDMLQKHAEQPPPTAQTQSDEG